MADNIPITQGAGPDQAAADDIGGVLFQRIKVVHGADGVNDGDVSRTNPLPVEVSYGELVEAIEALRFAVQALVSTIGAALPSAQGWPIMEARQPTAANLQATVSQGTAANLQCTATISGTPTVNLSAGQTLATLTNQSQMGGLATNDYMVALMHLQADGLRANIAVT